MHNIVSKSLFTIPEIFRSHTNIISGESTRHGGVSERPFQSLNLGGSTPAGIENDKPAHILENNIRFFSGLGIQFERVAKSHQIHGIEILDVTEPGRYEGFDALITQIPGIQLAVTVADCTPILIYDPIQKAVAAIHAGWRGTVGQIAAKTVQRMSQDFGTDPKNCLAYVGTCIDLNNFEVGDEVAAHFNSEHKLFKADTNKYYVDLKGANQQQLHMAGVPLSQIEISPYSTVINNEDYFSYRKENGVTGRMLATIGLK